MPPPDATATRPPTDPGTGPAGGPLAPPGYAILGELGRGGMGVVYHARQTRLHRDTALKMVLGADRVDPKGLIRFLAEAEAVAAVRHPGVVQVYEFGEFEGRPFLAMEYLPGGSLADRLAAGPLTPTAVTALIGRVARAVQAAHEAGIVHRDLKPTNVLFDAAGDPKVTDFGLAKRTTAHDLTKTGALMGTPAYMAPEQARGNAKFVGPGADVHALGAMLFECLTGRPPFDADDTVGLLMKVANDDPPSLRSVAPSVPRDLDLICRKCLAKEPHERYTTAAGLADDLARFAAGEPVSVRAAGRAERLARWARRNPTRAAAYSLTLLAAVLAGLTSGAVWLWQRAEHDRYDAVVSRDANLKLLGELNVEHNKSINALARETLALNTAEAARTTAEAARDSEQQAKESLVGLGYARNVDLAYREYEANNLDRARALLDLCPPDLRNWEWRYVRRICHAHRLSLAHTDLVRTAVYSPDGTRIATAANDRTVHVWDADNGGLVYRVDEPGRVNALAYSPEGTRIAVGTGDGHLAVRDAATGTVVTRFAKQDSLVSDVILGPGGRLLAATYGTNTARVWDVATGTERLVLPVSSFIGAPVALSPVGSTAYHVAAGGREVRAWDAATGTDRPLLAARNEQFLFVAISPDGTRLATSARLSGTVRLWDRGTGTAVATLQGHTAALVGLSFSRNGRRLLTAGMDGTARVWSAASGIERAVLRMKESVGLQYEVVKADINRDGTRVVATVAGRPPVVWEAAFGRRVATIKGVTGGEAAFSPDGTRVLTWGDGGEARVWDAAGGTDHSTRPTVPGDPGPPLPLEVFTEPTGRVRLRDPQTGKTRVALVGHAKQVKVGAFTPDGTRVATGDEAGSVRVWDVATGRQQSAVDDPGGFGGFRFDNSRINGGPIGFSPDGRRVAVGWTSGAVKVFDADNGRVLAVVPRGAGAVQVVRFSPDGVRLLVSSVSGTVIRDATNGGPLVRLVGERRALVEAAGFSPDGTRVVTARQDRTLTVWDTQSGHEILTLAVPVPPGLPEIAFRVVAVGFSADGARLQTVGVNDETTVWDTGFVGGADRPREAAPPPRPVE